MPRDSGAFAGLINLETLDLRHNDLTELNCSGATLEHLRPLDFGILSSSISGLGIVESIASLVLDDTERSKSLIDPLADDVADQTSIVNVSSVNLIFTDPYPSDLTALLVISSLDNVRIDPSLFNRYRAELNAFAAIPGNKVTVVLEPSLAFALFLLSNAWQRGNSRR